MHIFGFWIPKLSKSSLEQRKQEDKFLLSEEKDEDRVWGILKYQHPIDEDIKILLEKETSSFPKKLFLKRLFYDDESGIFFFYTEERLRKSAISNVQRSIYSVFKEMFHSHEHHFGDEDSILVAYHTEVKELPAKIGIAKLWRDCLLHYIEKYREKFEGAVEFSNFLRDTRKLYDDKKLSLRDMDAISDLIFELYGLVGELAYWKFLITELTTREKLNGTILPAIEGKLEKELNFFLDIYQSKLNFIKNEMEFYLSVLRNKNLISLTELSEEYLENEKEAFLVTYKSLKVGALGFSIGIGSLIYSIIVSIISIIFAANLSKTICSILALIITFSIIVYSYIFLTDSD